MLFRFLVFFSWVKAIFLFLSSFFSGRKAITMRFSTCDSFMIFDKMFRHAVPVLPPSAAMMIRFLKLLSMMLNFSLNCFRILLLMSFLIVAFSSWLRLSCIFISAFIISRCSVFQSAKAVDVSWKIFHSLVNHKKY